LKIFRLIILFSFCVTLVFCFSQIPVSNTSKEKLLAQYLQADHIFRQGEIIINRRDYTEEKEIELNKNALASFRRLLADFKKSETAYDSILFFTNYKIGVLEHYFENLTAAGKAYADAISLKQKLPLIEDSFLFKPYLYLGIILYNESQFDSAISIYKKAENISAKYTRPLQESERLYNTLGALYNEMGNYNQSKNYFEKAIQVLSHNNPYYKELLVNYKINLASSLTKTENFEEAIRIYESILPLNENKDIILHNMGVINLQLGSVKKAISYFKQVHYHDERRIKLFNDFASAYFNINKYDSAWLYLEYADSLNKGNSKKTIPRGQTYKLTGDLLTAEKKYEQAIIYYQLAITNFYPGFTEKETDNNPESFTGIFSYINLFNTLTAKADALEKLYKEKNSTATLEASLQAYQSAYKLAGYVEKSYDSDEARLFLNNIKYTTHSKAIDISLELYEKTKNINYLELAWQFDQRNKASVLSYNINENEIRKNAPKTATSAKEFELKENITRLSLKAAQVNDSIKLQTIQNTIRDYEIELGKIQEKINESEVLKGIILAANIPRIDFLQKNILDKTTALLSYHLSDKELLIICITDNSFDYRKIPLADSFYTTITKMVKALHTVNDDKKYEGSLAATQLYSTLIKPVYEFIKNKKRLIIIPDDELNYVPFEALENENRKYLAEFYSIQYQYSAYLLNSVNRKYGAEGTLSFAPFSNASSTGFNRLPYSGEEINGLNGKIFIDKEATRQNFINSANKYSVIHLATHAQANDKLPFQSFIVFYPEQKNDSTDYKLYAQEIYNLNLDSTRLVILSACETGAGQLIKGEGLMSLSRAFAYAGCPNIVTSLWKAEDKTTAFISKRFHFYLDKGNTIDNALQKAKIDLLNSNEIEPSLKTPNYWSHLIFIGNYQAEKPAQTWKWLTGFIVFTGIVILFLMYRRRAIPE